MLTIDPRQVLGCAGAGLAVLVVGAGVYYVLYRLISWFVGPLF